MNWHDYFVCDPATGELWFKRRPVESFKSKRAHGIFNALCAGKVAGTRRKDGYVLVGIDGKQYYAHRIVWEMVEGSIPPGMLVDHKNGTDAGNGIGNLRIASKSQNGANGKARNPRSGFKGVTRNHIGRWQAGVTVNRKAIYLGCFDTPEEAHEAYRAGSAKYHGEFSRTQ